MACIVSDGDKEQPRIKPCNEGSRYPPTGGYCDRLDRISKILQVLTAAGGGDKETKWCHKGG